MSPFRILSKLRMMEVVVTTGATKTCKAVSKCQQISTNQHPCSYRPDALPVAQPIKALKENLQRKKNSLRYLENLSNSDLVMSLMANWLTVAVVEPTASDTITRALSSSIPTTCHPQCTVRTALQSNHRNLSWLFNTAAAAVWLGGRVVRMPNCNQQVEVSNPGLPAVEYNLGQPSPK